MKVTYPFLITGPHHSGSSPDSTTSLSLSPTPSLPPGSGVSRLPADKADQCWKRLLQIRQIRQTRGDTRSRSHTQNTPARRQSLLSFVHNHHDNRPPDACLHELCVCVWTGSRGERELRCWTTSTTSCTGRARPRWVWARPGRKTSWRTGDTEVCWSPSRWTWTCREAWGDTVYSSLSSVTFV